MLQVDEKEAHFQSDTGLVQGERGNGHSVDEYMNEEQKVVVVVIDLGQNGVKRARFFFLRDEMRGGKRTFLHRKRCKIDFKNASRKYGNLGCAGQNFEVKNV